METRNNIQSQLLILTNYNNFKTVFKGLVLFAILFPFIISCSSTKQTFSSTEKTAVFLPPKTEYYVDLFIEEIDGEKTKFKLGDTAEIDEGQHELRIRLEHQPASGTSIVVGGIANLLLRSTTNKTFSSIINVNVEKGQVYRLVTEDFKDGLAIKLHNETTSETQAVYKFKLEEGKFETVF